MEYLHGLVEEFPFLSEDPARTNAAQGCYVLSGLHPMQVNIIRERDPMTGALTAREEEYGIELIVCCQLPPHPDDERAFRGEFDTRPTAVPQWELVARIPGDSTYTPLVWVPRIFQQNGQPPMPATHNDIYERLKLHVEAFPGYDVMDEQPDKPRALPLAVDMDLDMDS